MKKKISILIISLFFLNSCSSDGQVYRGGGIGQTVAGDTNFVTVSNIWSALDGLPLAEKHCAGFNKKALIRSYGTFYSGHYDCVIRTVKGDKNLVEVSYYGSEDNSFPHASQHCFKFNKIAKYKGKDLDTHIFDCVDK
mgnify:FL=1